MLARNVDEFEAPSREIVIQPARVRRMRSPRLISREESISILNLPTLSSVGMRMTVVHRHSTFDLSRPTAKSKLETIRAISSFI